MAVSTGLTGISVETVDVQPGDHPVMTGVSDLRVSSVGGLEINSSAAEAAAWMDGIPMIAVGSYGDGRFAVVGDDHIFDNRWYVDSMNQLFGDNLVRWVMYLMDTP